MSLFSLLFGFHGRIGRAHWWLGMTIVAASAASIVVGIGILRMHPIFFLPSALLSTFPIFALGIKRLHDRDLTGWYIGWITVIPAILLLLASRIAEGSPVWWMFVSSAIALFAWGLTELGLRRGVEGVNEYDESDADETAIPAL
ncbi:MAG: DUF805 domain-containing protein [Pseudorhodoplanes sp.]|uniref:DUF805 domain-containing protein n=1 Tax=Pseudorhodoplanes sp. TaxID=1934341 RepID=UPI003D11CD99